MQGMHRVCTEQTPKPRQGKALKIRAYHNYHEYHKYIYTYGKNKKAYITKYDCAFLNNYIYLYYF